MAKSTRSKVKRSYRHKKREEGVYAATEAARLNRMNAKLLAVAAAPKPLVEEEKDADDEDEMRGWYMFAAFGIMDADTITPERQEMFRVDGLRTSEEDKAQGTVEENTAPMDIVGDAPTRISTHGPRGSRREEWRKSKGMEPRPKRHGTNRQGVPVATRKAGRSQRRR
ncbi:hypothetical protein PC9H_005223 [Pleurotus ostreatus]|uniref:DUF2423 domain-containing protein n=1 Tax=Pleurotus ostreatus TaxID=5322 RepID=A0A8H7A030_PLEOS|nr:uncharacterized protein PC9H_005223 [Pleurotus ostreatus]KAF7433273.1 hypothetical protein PC9H_005223 [Pleurotus ostreatus]